MSWKFVCELEKIPAGGSVAVLHGIEQIAVFRPHDDATLFATQNRCPHSGQNVLSRGILGDAAGRPKVVCPLHKHGYHLEDGNSLVEGHGCLTTYLSRVDAGKVYLDLPELVS